MGEEQMIQIFKTYSDVLKIDTMLERIIRELLWGIVKVLGYIVDAISAITDKLFVLDRFYNDPHVVEFINSAKPLIAVLFGISIITIGYQLMFSQTKQFRKIGMNALVAIAVILVLPMAMDQMNILTNAGVTAVKGTPKDLTNQIIKDNVTDILLYDQVDFKKEDISALENPNNIILENIRYIDSTLTIESGSKNGKLFDSKLATDVEGKLSIKGLANGMTDVIWKEYYYRFDINFLNIILSLGFLGATLAFTCFKLAKLIFELAYNKFLAILVAPTDINDGQKTKQIIQNIMSTFIVTFLIAVFLKFYILFVGMCSGIKGIEGVILLVAGSFAVIDGPNMVEKLFGIDAGLRSGFNTMAGIYMGGKTAMAGVSKLGGTAKRMAQGTGKVAGSTLGTGAGLVAGGIGNKKNDSVSKDMEKDQEKKNSDANKGKSIYPDMAKDQAKENGNLKNGNIERGNIVNSNTANTGNSSKQAGTAGTSGPDGNTKGNGIQGHQSIYDEMGNGNGESSIKGNDNQEHTSIYDDMNGASNDTYPKNKTEPIRQDDNKSSYQTMGQHRVEKALNNPIIRQTMESYNRGRNTAQSIREKRNNKDK